MLHFHVFTDGSVNTQRKVGYGAYLLVPDLNTPIDLIKDTVCVKRFEKTSSTVLELKTFLWGLGEAVSFANDRELVLTAYTDSQNIVGLPARRTRLEQRNYVSNNNKRLRNYELYQDFYRLMSSLNCTLVKVVGHQASSKKDKIDRLFGLVDQASRRALREAVD